MMVYMIWEWTVDRYVLTTYAKKTRPGVSLETHVPYEDLRAYQIFFMTATHRWYCPARFSDIARLKAYWAVHSSSQVFNYYAIQKVILDMLQWVML